MVKHIQTICQYQSANCFSVFYHFVGFVFKWLIEALTAFTVNSFSFVDRQADKSKNQAPKHHILGRKNNFGSYHHPNYFSRIGPE